jgi:hypothetical protein
MARELEKGQERVDVINDCVELFKNCHWKTWICTINACWYNICIPLPNVTSYVKICSFLFCTSSSGQHIKSRKQTP